MPRFQSKNIALNSDIFLSIRTPSERLAQRIFAELNEIIKTFEQNFSRFLPESQLTKLNLNAGKKFRASSELIELTRKAKQMAGESNGLYNPLTLPALQRAGYVGSWPKPDKFTKELNYSDRKITSIDKLEIGGNLQCTPRRCTSGWIKIPANSALDFGGIGKGYLLDQLAEYVEKNNVDDFWFSLGGDIILSGNDEDRVGWEVEIADLNSDKPFTEKIVTTGEKIAIATSGIIKRKGIKNNQPWHHLIDPKTSQPAKTDILTATVVADTATEADIWAKSVVILG